MEKLLTIAEYAESQGVTVQAIYAKIKAGNINYKEQQGKYFIPVAIKLRTAEQMTDEEASQLMALVFGISSWKAKGMTIEVTRNKGYSIEISTDNYYIEYTNNGDFYHEFTQGSFERCVSFNMRRVYQFLKEKCFEQ